MIYVSYLPDAEGSTSGRILQVMRNANLRPELLSFPVVKVDEWREDYGTDFHVVDGVVVPKP